MKILAGATLVLLDNLHNMQMKPAIIDISFFDSNSVNIPHNVRNKTGVYTHVFRVCGLDKPISKVIMCAN